MAQGGSSKIRGRVADLSTGDPLPGANVILVGTSFGGSSDISGEYLITNVPPGTYSIQFSYIGYKSYKAENVKVLPDSTFVLDANLTPESLTGETVLITAQKQGQIGAINKQLASNSIQDIVAKDYIQEVPDLNAAESIGRLPGVSLERDGGEGNKVIIDGLAPQYNNIYVDGVQLNGTDLDRSAGLEIIQNEMLEGIVLSKSLTPDMDADALGGTVNLTLKEAETGFHVNAVAQGAYDNYNNNASNYKFSLGMSDRFYDNSLGIIGNFVTSKIDRSNDQFGAAYNSITPAGQPWSVQDNWGQVQQTLDERYRSEGDIVIDYETKFMKLKIDNMLSQQIDENTQRNNFFQMAGFSSFQSQIYNSKPITTIRSHSLSDVFSFLNTELTVDASYSRTTNSNNEDYYEFLDLNLLPAIPPATLIGAQPADVISNSFNTAVPKTSDLQQNLLETTGRKDETYTYKADWKIPYSITKEISGNFKLGAFFSDKDRNSDYDQLDGEFLGGRGEQIWAEMEASGEFNDIVFNDTKGINIPQSNGVPTQNWEVLNYNWGKLLGGRFHMGYTENTSALDSFMKRSAAFTSNFYITDGIPTYQNSYANNEKKSAAYIMTELHLGENLMLLPGVRYEDFHSVYSSYFIQASNESVNGIQYIFPVSSVNGNNYWFPSVNSKYTINDWMDVRAAYFKSCTRPNYLDLSPGLVADNGDQNLIGYNPYLKPAIDDNFDVIYSFHSNEIGLFSIDGFYKQIAGLEYYLQGYQPQFYDEVINAPPSLIAELEAPRVLYNNSPLFKTKGQLFSGGGGYNGYPINNPNESYYRGVELNWETNFWYLPGLLSNLILDVNYTYISSTTLYPYLHVVTVVVPKPSSVATYETRQDRMLDQPTDMWNIRVGWDYKGFSTRVSFRYQGQALSSLDPTLQLQDTYSKAQFIVDWSAKQNLSKNLSIQADVSNLNQYIDESDIHLNNVLYPTSMASYGLLADIGLRYEIQ